MCETIFNTLSWSPSVRMNSTMNKIARWRLARKITLGALMLTGCFATASAVSHRLHSASFQQCHSHGTIVRVAHDYTYTGIGVVMVQEGQDFVVKAVLPDSPAQGKIVPGAKLLTVDGQHPEHLRAWSRLIRGEANTSVQLEVQHGDSESQTVTLERQLIHHRR